MPRRQPGEGSFRRVDRNGKTIKDDKVPASEVAFYQWRMSVPGVGGKQGRVIRQAQTMRELNSKVADARRQLEKGVDLSGRRPTVQQWIEHWIAEVRPIREPSPRTVEGYWADLRLYISPVIGSIRLEKLTGEDVNRLWSAMLTGTRGVKKPVSKGTVLHARRTLHAALASAVKTKKIAWNVVDDAESPRDDSAEITPLTTAEAHAILLAARGLRNESRWRIALSLGLRQGEALGLQLDDIDWDSAELLVRRQIQRVVYRHGCADPEQCLLPPSRRVPKPHKGRGADCPQRQGDGLVVRQNKNRTTRRVPIPATLLAELRVHVDQLAAEKAKARNLWAKNVPGGGWLYPNERGDKADPRRDYAQWRALLAKAGVRHARLHDAKHTAVSALIGAGIDQRVIQETFDVRAQATYERYAHVAGRKKQLGEAMENALGPVSPSLKVVNGSSE